MRKSTTCCILFVKTNTRVRSDNTVAILHVSIDHLLFSVFVYKPYSGNHSL